MSINFGLAVHEIHWGDVATWLESIGTTGTLITGIVIILRDRLNTYRALINELTVSLEPPEKGTTPILTLVVQNPLKRPFHGLDIYLLGIGALFEDGHEADIGIHLYTAQLMGRRTLRYQAFSGASGVLPTESILTYRVTDGYGRTWFVERKKLPKLVNRRNRWLINRRLKSLNTQIRQQAGSNYVKPSWQEWQVTQMPA